MKTLLSVLLGLCTFVMATEQRVEIVVGKYCVMKIEMGQSFECYGPDVNHLLCKGLMLTYKPGCENLRVVKN